MGRSARLFKKLHHPLSLLSRMQSRFPAVQSNAMRRDSFAPGQLDAPGWLPVVSKYPPISSCTMVQINGQFVANSMRPVPLVLADDAIRSLYRSRFPATIIAPALVVLSSDTASEASRFVQRIKELRLEAGVPAGSGALTSDHPIVKTVIEEFVARYTFGGTLLKRIQSDAANVAKAEDKAAARPPGPPPSSPSPSTAATGEAATGAAATDDSLFEFLRTYSGKRKDEPSPPSRQASKDDPSGTSPA